MPPIVVRDPLAAKRSGKPPSTLAQSRPNRPGTLPAKPAPAAKASSLPSQGLFSPRVSRPQVVYLTGQLAVMVQTGISLANALEGIRRQEKNPTLKRVLGELGEALERGESFSAALARFPRIFDRTYVAVVKAAEVSGSLGPMLERLALSLRKSHETRARIRAALAYPVTMLLMAVGVCVFLLAYVMPRFTPLFQSRGASLPTPTKIVLAISEAITTWWYLWIGLVAVIVIGGIIAQRNPSGKRWLDAVKLNLPVVGGVLRKFAVCQSVRTLGTLLSGGVTMLEALRLTAEAVGNAQYEALWQKVEQEITVGKKLSECLGESNLVPPTVLQMIAAGEETGKLADVLLRLADYLEADVDIATKTATSLMEPILIGVMGLIVGTIGLAVLLPIFSLSRPM